MVNEERVVGRLQVLAGETRSSIAAAAWKHAGGSSYRIPVKRLGATVVMHTNVWDFYSFFQNDSAAGRQAVRTVAGIIRSRVIEKHGVFERCTWDNSTSVFAEVPSCGDERQHALQNPVDAAVAAALLIAADFEVYGNRHDLCLGIGLVVSRHMSESFSSMEGDHPPEMATFAQIVDADSATYNSHALAERLSSGRNFDDIAVATSGGERGESSPFGPNHFRTINDLGAAIAARANKHSMILLAGSENDVSVLSSGVLGDSNSSRPKLPFGYRRALGLDPRRLDYLGPVWVLSFTS